jgi:hypothetical protein
MMSSISSTTSLSLAFARYAKHVEEIMHTRSILDTFDTSYDELKELVADLWTTHDSFGEDLSEATDEGDDN